MASKKALPRQQSLLEPEIINPFVHSLHLDFYQRLKIALMSVTIAPIRLILVGLLLMMAWPLAALAISFRSEEDKNRPLAGWRRSIATPVKWIGRAIAFAMGFHYIRIKGKCASSAEAPIGCIASHSSLFDGFSIFCGPELPSVVSKSQVLSLPILGTLIKFTQPVLVLREDPDSRLKTIQEIQKRAKAGGKWPQIIIFPEGTCTNRSCLITFKPGAFYPGVPVQCVCLKYPNKLDTVTWTWDGPGGFILLWYTLCQFHNYLEIEYLPVYTPSEEEKKDAKLFAENVRKKMAECLGVPVTDHTYDDCRLMSLARKLELPMNAGIIEFFKLHKKLSMSFEHAKELLEKFSKIDKNKYGRITMEEFAEYLHLPESKILQEVFQTYDRNKSGTIDFREYVIGLSLISEPVNTKDTLELAFQIFDSEDKGFISLESLTSVLHNAFGMEESDVEVLFRDVDADKDGKINFAEFKLYAEQKPEYAKLFTAYQEAKAQSNGFSVVFSEDEEKSKTD